MSGVLIPAAPGLSVKAVSADTAELLESLRVPGPLPKEARKTLARNGTVLLRLVLDSMLEVRTRDGFISGSSVGAYLNPLKTKKEPCTRPAILSLQAVQYAQALTCANPPALSARMYFYNRLPATYRWARHLGSPSDFARFLGIEAGTNIRKLLDHKWMALEPSPENPGWLSWRSLHRPYKHSRYKLYLSPLWEDIQDTLSIALPIMTDLRLPAFKLGGDLHGILRPDKMVIYSSTFEELSTAASMLLTGLRGIRAHGVPFTAAIDSEGLLSWGIDPPRHQRLSTWQGTSWRRWVTDQLAVALVAAKSKPSETTLQPWEFALQRLAMEGIDIETWVPKNIEWMDVKPR